MEIRTEKSSPVHMRIFGFYPCAILNIVMHLFPLVQEEIFIMFIMRNTSKLCILFQKELFHIPIITVVNLIIRVHLRSIEIKVLFEGIQTELALKITQLWCALNGYPYLNKMHVLGCEIYNCYLFSIAN